MKRSSLRFSYSSINILKFEFAVIDSERFNERTKKGFCGRKIGSAQVSKLFNTESLGATSLQAFFLGR
jgi:hypothetical protein